MRFRVILASLILAFSTAGIAFELTINNKTGSGLGVNSPDYCYLGNSIPAGTSKYSAPDNCATNIAGLTIQFYGNSIKTRCNLWTCIGASYYGGVLTLTN